MNHRWAIFISGRGSTAQSLMDLVDLIDIKLVISNRTKAVGLVRARRMGIATWTMNKSTNWLEVDSILKSKKINRIFLLGFMKLLPADFVEKWQNKIFNIHPSLLPMYPGLHAIESSFKDRADMGVTIHRVVAEMDSGPIVLQKKVIAKGKQTTLEDVEAKIAGTEQRLIREMGHRYGVIR